jgi:hypothetical protein
MSSLRACVSEMSTILASRVFKKFKHAYDIILKPKTKKVWEVAEKNRGLGYNGLSERSRQRHERKTRDETQLGKELKEKRLVLLFFSSKGGA